MWLVLNKIRLKSFVKIFSNFFCKIFLSLGVSSHCVTRFNALTRSTSPNFFQKLFRSTTRVKAAWVDHIINSGHSISKLSSASAPFSVSSSSSITQWIAFSLRSSFQFMECISTVFIDVTPCSSWFR